MKEQFVHYELAVKLKELGFNEPCFGGWDKNKKWYYHPDSDITVDAPLYQQVFDWFTSKGYHSYIEGAYPWFRYYINTDDNRYEGFKHLKLEEARQACLEKLIELVENDRNINNVRTNNPTEC